MTDITPDQLEAQRAKKNAALENEVKELRKKLAASETARTEAETTASAIAELSAMGGNSQERSTGKTVLRRMCVNPHVADKKDHEFVEVELPTYFYTLNLPVSAVSLKTNGLEVFHGQTLELDVHELADYKSRVARCWDHESSINGNNENAYRRPTELRVR